MNTPITDIKQEFKTPLGIIHCGCKYIYNQQSSIKKKKYENGSSEILKTAGHLIEIVSFKIKAPLYNGETLSNSFGWIFRIEKFANIDENIETYCLLNKISEVITFDSTPGEHLDAIQAYNHEWTLHIGTEDGEILNLRAQNNDWFPLRLQNKEDFYHSITEIKQNGFVTKIPKLNKDEKIHIQYLAAYDNKSNQKIHTWLAVDMSKKNLEEWICIE